MTKPLPTGCIKDNDDIPWETFNILLESVTFDDKIGHFYIVDIQFDFKMQLKENLLTMRFIPPIMEKQKIIDPCERSLFQLLEQFVRGEMHLNPTERQLRHMQIFLRKTCCQCI